MARSEVPVFNIGDIVRVANREHIRKELRGEVGIVVRKTNSKCRVQFENKDEEFLNNEDLQRLIRHDSKDYTNAV